MSASTGQISYAIWNPPSAEFPIRYSLALFREIDFFAGDGYRRIPHGGLEVGAVLYGQGEPAGLTIRAYQPIECQHSFGPSFTLSAFDLEQLGKQIARPFITEAGEELEVVGWLISNCRSDLVLTEQEGRIFDEHFPGPRQVTLLVKPEKLKPTRYGFLARPRRGGLLDKACRDPFILPLSTKGGATEVREVREETFALPASGLPTAVVLPEIPAREIQPDKVDPPPPAPAPVVSAPVTPTQSEALAPTSASAPRPEELYARADAVAEPDWKPVFPCVPSPTPVPKPAEPEVTEPPALQAPVTTRSIEPTPLTPVPSVPDVRDQPSSAVATDSPAPLPAGAPSDESALPPANVVEAIEPPAAASPKLPGETTEDLTRSNREGAAERSPLSIYPRSRSGSRRQLDLEASQSEREESIEQTTESRRARKVSSPARELALGAAVLAVLAAAAIWTYLRLPAQLIPLNADVQPGQVVVTWAPELTKNAGRCAITTWIDGQPTLQALSADEKSEGKAIIQTNSSDVTIQLSAPRWYTERTGQIRVLRVVPSAPPSAAVLLKPSRRAFGPPQSDNPAPPLTGKPADPVPQRLPE